MSAAGAGRSGDDVIRICLAQMLASDGSPTSAELYEAVERRMPGAALSSNGKAAIRYYINRVAVSAGLVRPTILRGLAGGSPRMVAT